MPTELAKARLGIESRAGDSFVKGLIAPLVCRESSWRCLAERAFLKAMQGGCQVPLGVHSILTTASGNVKYLCLSGSVYSLDGKTYIYEGMKESIASDEDAIAVGAKVAKNGIRPRRCRAFERVCDWRTAACHNLQQCCPVGVISRGLGMRALAQLFGKENGRKSIFWCL